MIAIQLEFTVIAITDLSCGEHAKVMGFAPGQKSYRQKLLAMGLTPGTQFQLIRKAPLGDPIEIEVRGFSLSLRKSEAQQLKIERV